MHTDSRSLTQMDIWPAELHSAYWPEALVKIHFEKLVPKSTFRYDISEGVCNIFIFLVGLMQGAVYKELFVCVHDLLLFCWYPLISGIHQCFLIFALFLGKRKFHEWSRAVLPR